MKKNGFIATSLIYSFFLIFITLFLSVIADYLQQKVLLNTIETGIKQDINNSLGIQDFRVGDVLYFQVAISSIQANNTCVINDIQYKNSSNPNDILILGCYKNIETDTPISIKLNITGRRLQKDTNPPPGQSSITIIGW